MTSRPYPRPFGSFILLQLIGRGGMSEVELARQALSEANFVRFIVIKRIHTRHTGNESFVRMFQDEARINAELQHENIAQVYAFGKAEDEYYLAMEYVAGTDLRGVQSALFERSERLPIRIILRIVHDILSALEYAHGRVDTYGRPMNIVHRDVNPRNIMLSIRGEVKLIDFGVAKSDTKSEQTEKHALKGKFAYMAPEQIEQAERLDGRVDIFALGLVLQELLTGEYPFKDLSEVQIFHRILSGALPAPDISLLSEHPEPQSLLDLLRRALATERDDRFASAAEMRREVLRVADPMGGLPNAEEMAQSIRSIIPEEFDRIAANLRDYGRMDLTNFFNRRPSAAKTLVRASNVTETFELKRPPKPKPAAPIDHASNQAEDLTHTSHPRGGFRRILLASATLLLVLGYVMVLSLGYVIWDLLSSG